MIRVGIVQDGLRFSSCLESFQNVLESQLLEESRLSTLSKYSIFDLRISLMILLRTAL